MATSDCLLSISSYNMFGLRNGTGMLHELCESHRIVAVQETWLREDELYKLNLIQQDFQCCAASGMNDALSKSILKGRPFGGVAFLYHNSLSRCIEFIGCSSDNRCIVIKLSINNLVLLLFNVYFPCFENSLEYRDELSALTGFIEDTLNRCSYNGAVILGDTNFDITPGHSGYSILDSLLSSANMSACDDLVSGSIITNTYVNEALGCSSRIDHFFMSNHLKGCIKSVSVVDSCINTSDHRPISLKLDLAGMSQAAPLNTLPPSHNAHSLPKSATHYNLRWDRSNTADYYELTRVLLSNIAYDRTLANCSLNCSAASHKAAINDHYLRIVNALKEAERATIPRIPNKALKPFWTQELDNWKQKSILWHSIWCSSGRPLSGLIYKIKNSCKLKYKLAIKNALLEYENRFNDDLLTHFVNKNTPEFWKCWSSKMRRNIVKDVFMNGSNDDIIVADSFANHFESVYFDSAGDSRIKNEFDALLSRTPQTHDAPQVRSHFSVELVDACIRKLKAGKAAGFDQITSEHLLFAHPCVVIHLCTLYQDMATHCVVPDEFGKGVIVPILKDKLGNVNDTNNYRGITLIPVVSKLFELVLLEICAPFFITDELQFGFKKGLGCSNALFLLHETVDYFLSQGSSIFAASLDLKKAFDRVNYFKLFSSLITAGLPKWTVILLVNWYSKISVTVRWKNALSRTFCVRSGVRQGSVISPTLFNMFANKFLSDLRDCNAGCKINGYFVGAIMYADDLFILSASVEGLQKMLNCCEAVSSDLALEFNCNKCSCINIGPAARYTLSDMILCSNNVKWSTTFSYLGITFCAGKKLSVDINVIKRKFFASTNCILGNTNTMDDILKLSLMESYCLPILMYATAAIKLSNEQINEINASWNSVYRRIFRYNKWESVHSCIVALGRLDFKSLRLHTRLKFCRAGLISSNATYAFVMRRHYFSAGFKLMCHDSGLIACDYDRFDLLPFGHIRTCVHHTFKVS